MWRVLLGLARVKSDAFFFKQIRRLARSRLKRTQKVIDVVIDDLKMRLIPAENTCDMTIALTGTHTAISEVESLEPSEIQGTTFIDIGANVGIFTLLASRAVGASGQVIAFEPHPYTYQKLSFNILANNLHNVCKFNCAVGAREEELRLYSASKWNAGRNSLDASLSRNEDAVVVKVITLNDALNMVSHTRVSAIKADIEGHEAEALVPFFESAKQSSFPQYVLIEHVHEHLWKSDLRGTLAKCGYETILEDEMNTHFALRHQ